MTANKTIQDFEREIRECVKCGVCQSYCPTYRIGKKEGMVARGKIALASALLEGDLDLDVELQRDVSMCLMCGSCMNKCPNNVPTHEIIGAVRREISDNRGMPLLSKGISTLLGYPKLMASLAKGGAIVSPLVLKKVPGSSGLRMRFPTPLMNKRTVPGVAYKNLFDRVPEFIQGEPDKAVIGFFAGCSITYLYPELGELAVSILSDMGYSVYIPREQGCCGIPALSSGDGNRVEELAGKNIEAFTKEKVDQIVTACASCNGGIGEYYSTMKADNDHFTSKVIDLSDFLVREGLLAKLAALPAQANAANVTYHDPCHLKTQGITREPRSILNVLPNVNFTEMTAADTCCGLGGTFSVYHYEESKAIGAMKVVHIAEAGAELVATSCPGCIMQLQDSINHAGQTLRAVHILELIAEALSQSTAD